MPIEGFKWQINNNVILYIYSLLSHIGTSSSMAIDLDAVRVWFTYAFVVAFAAWMVVSGCGTPVLHTYRSSLAGTLLVMRKSFIGALHGSTPTGLKMCLQ